MFIEQDMGASHKSRMGVDGDSGIIGQTESPKVGSIDIGGGVGTGVIVWYMRAMYSRCDPTCMT